MVAVKVYLLTGSRPLKYAPPRGTLCLPPDEYNRVVDQFSDARSSNCAVFCVGELSELTSFSTTEYNNVLAAIRDANNISVEFQFLEKALMEVEEDINALMKKHQ